MFTSAPGWTRTLAAWCYNYNNGSANVTQQFALPSVTTDFCVPYGKQSNNAVVNPPWRNNDTFQIISSGLDGLYGNLALRTAGTPTGLSPGDYDNITNFVQNGSTLEDEMK